jgi:hypothetical protein
MKARKQHTKTFEELTYSEQSKAINAEIVHLGRAINANIRRAKKENKPLPIEKRIEQVERLVKRLKAKYS